MIFSLYHNQYSKVEVLIILSHNSLLFSNCTRPSFIIRSEVQQKQFYSSWISLSKSYRTLVIIKYRLLVGNRSITNSQLWVINLYSCKFSPTCTYRCCGIVNCILASQSEWKYLDFAFFKYGLIPPKFKLNLLTHFQAGVGSRERSGVGWSATLWEWWRHGTRGIGQHFLRQFE